MKANNLPNNNSFKEIIYKTFHNKMQQQSGKVKLFADIISICSNDVKQPTDYEK